MLQQPARLSLGISRPWCAHCVICVGVQHPFLCRCSVHKNKTNRTMSFSYSGDIKMLQCCRACWCYGTGAPERLNIMDTMVQRVTLGYQGFLEGPSASRKHCILGSNSVLLPSGSLDLPLFLQPSVYTTMTSLHACSRITFFWAMGWRFAGSAKLVVTSFKKKCKMFDQI